MSSIILASSSPYRRNLLARIAPTFKIAIPNIDEAPHPLETPWDLTSRLALEKATAVAKSHAHGLIIGSDQVACLDHQILGKPGTRDHAIRQLEACSGKTVTFYTGLCLLNAATHHHHLACERFVVHFRTLSHEQICHYIDRENPLDCAGSFKCEGLGIALFTRMEGDDPTTLVGLPLIRLSEFLLKAGVDVLTTTPAEPFQEPRD